MKIVHLAKYYLPHLGGVEIHLKEINSLLVKMGHEVTVVTQQYDLKLSDEADYDGVKVIRICDNKTNPYLQKKHVWSFIKSHKEIFDEADIIHVHDVFWWLLPIYKSIRKKAYITFHGWETEYPVKFNAKFQRYLYSKLAKGSIHVGSWIQKFYYDKPNLITYGGINAKRFTRSGIDTESNNNSDNNTFKVDTNKNRSLNITFVGRLSTDNDVDKYIELIKLLLVKGQKIKITWVGDGELRKECESLGRVTGFVKNVSKYLVDNDFVFASSYLSILEAQLLENNVCAFYSNDLKKAYLNTFPGNKYLLIAPSVEVMMKKISFLLRSPKLKKQSAKKASRFAKAQTWKKVLDLYMFLWGLV